MCVQLAYLYFNFAVKIKIILKLINKQSGCVEVNQLIINLFRFTVILEPYGKLGTTTAI